MLLVWLCIDEDPQWGMPLMSDQRELLSRGYRDLGAPVVRFSSTEGTIFFYPSFDDYCIKMPLSDAKMCRKNDLGGCETTAACTTPEGGE